MQVTRLLFELLVFSFALAHWAMPEWDLFGFSTLHVPTNKYALVGDALLWFITAAIGWLYVFERPVLKASLLLMVLWGGLEIAVALTGFGVATLPSDAALAKNFQRNKAKFSRLADMAGEDADVESILFDSFRFTEKSQAESTSPPKLTPERWDEYRQLFRAVRAKGLTRAPGLEIDFFLPVAEERELSRIVIKGYAHSAKEPSPLVDSLDKISPRQQVPFYKKLENNWYLYYLWLDD